MALSQDLMGSGVPPLTASMLGNDPQAVTGTGTAQATAAAIRSTNSEVTGASSQTGAILPANAKVGTPYYVASVGGTAAVIYCPVGHTLNGTSNGGATFGAATGFAIFMQTRKGVWWCTGTATLSVS